jgi:hypothetical protein
MRREHVHEATIALGVFVHDDELRENGDGFKINGESPEHLQENTTTNKEKGASMNHRK